MSRYERPNIRAMHGYTWGEQPEDDRTIKLNTNENPYPVSPAVQAALRSIDVATLRTYPQPTADRLRDAIAEHHTVSRNNVIVTNGGDEALRLAMTTFVEPGSSFGMAEPSYSLYPVLAAIHDAGVIEVPLQHDWSMPENFAGRLNESAAQLACVVNPHAPSGSLYDVDTLRRIAFELDGVLLIDEAYADFIDEGNPYDSAPLINEFDNVLILRTFSKGYSLAGLRLGYLLGSDALIDPVLSKTRDSYNIDHISQVLGLAALEDKVYARETWTKVRSERSRLSNDLAQMGLTSPPSQSNFILARIPPDAGVSAEQVYERLKTSGILVRYFAAPRLADRLRITVGTPQQNDALTKALQEILRPHAAPG